MNDASSAVNDASSARPKRQEQEHASPEVTEVAPNILRSQLPIFLPGLGHVNCYFLQDERGVAIVDPGLPGPQSWRALVDRLKQAGYKPKDVHTVVVTHSHPDHFGGAGRFRDQYGADILTHRSFHTWFDPADDKESVADAEANAPADDGAPPKTPWGREMPVAGRGEAPAAAEPSHPVPRDAARSCGASSARRRRPAASTTPRWSRWPGASGSRCTPPATPPTTSASSTPPRAWCSRATTSYRRSPRTSRAIGGGDDPLRQFFTSLEKVADLDGVRIALPAHGHPFADLRGRAAEIRQHHEERLDTLRAAAGELGTASVEQLMQRLFKQRSWGQMAESETYAHLEHLRATGEAESRLEHGSLVYRLVD